MSTSTAANRFVVKHNAVGPVMRCASSEAEERSYRMALDGKGCVWFYCLEATSPGDTVYFHDPNDLHSDGFAGRTITFRIGKTGQYLAKGPWHSNTDALYERTQIDLRAKHLTFGAVALRRSYDHLDTVLEDLLHIDKEPELGEFSRVEKIAQGHADRLGHPVFYYSESSGGSGCGPVYPTGTGYREWQEWFAKEKDRG